MPFFLHPHRTSPIKGEELKFEIPEHVHYNFNKEVFKA